MKKARTPQQKVMAARRIIRQKAAYMELVHEMAKPENWAEVNGMFIWQKPGSPIKLALDTLEKYKARKRPATLKKVKAGLYNYRGHTITRQGTLHVPLFYARPIGDEATAEGVKHFHGLPTMRQCMDDIDQYYRDRERH